MKDLGKWQVISLISQIVAMLLGMVSTFVIIRILSVSEWGLVQLAISIGGALGIYQHLGLVSASTREISSAKKEEDVFKIFVTSTVVRYFVTLPISVGLFFAAEHIAVNLYNNPDLIFPLRIYAVTLLFQGVQGILNSVISGTKRFKQLFIYQVVISVVNILIFIPFVFFLKVEGYFYAFLLFNIISTITLSFLAFKPLKGKLKLPSKKDFTKFFKEIFSISIAIYIVKILYTNWEKLGSNFLGLSNPAETIAIYAFAVLYAKKLMSISDSVTTVNIPVFSEKYENDQEEFKKTFALNFNKIFSFVVFVGTFAAYFAPLLIKILVGSDKYNESIPLIAPMMFSFIIYSFINIISSSVMIPAKMAKSMVASYVILILGTVVSYLALFRFTSVLNAVSWAMVGGSISCLYFMHHWIKKRMKFTFLNVDHVAVLASSLSISLLANSDVLWIKIVAFFPLAGLLIWSFILAGLISKEDILSLISKYKLLLTRRPSNERKK